MISIDKECKYCKISFEDGMGFKKIGKHVKHTHNKTMLEMYMDVGLITEEDFPICNGCGERIDLRTHVRSYKILQDPNKDYYHDNECKSKAESYKENLRKSWKPLGWASPDYVSSPETNEKRRLAIIRKHETDPAYRLKISISNLGKKRTPEQCKKISDARKGMKFTAEHRNNMSRAITKKMLEGWYFGNRCEYLTKDKKRLIFRSTYELLLAYFLDSYNEVESWKYEPTILKHPTENKRYVPDFLVKYKNGETYLIECDRKVGFKEKFGYEWKIDAGKEYCNRMGYNFLVVDYDSIIKLYIDNKISINLSTLFSIAKNRKGIFQLSKYLYDIKNLNYNITIDEYDLNYPKFEDNKIIEFKKEIHANGKKDKSKMWILANNPSFWAARWGTARWGLYDALKQKVSMNGILKNIAKYKLDLSPLGIIKQAMRERYSVSFFPAWWMKWILSGLEKEFDLKPETILDPSAGWGGRLVGTYQFDPNIKYVGIDPNKDTIDGLKNISSKLNYNTELYSIKLQDFDSTDRKFDLICTSPPYWDREIYSQDTINDINGYYETINKINAKYLILNFGSDDWSTYEESTNKILDNWKLIDTWKIKLSRHPFRKSLSNKYELFLIFANK